MTSQGQIAKNNSKREMLFYVWFNISIEVSLNLFFYSLDLTSPLEMLLVSCFMGLPISDEPGGSPNQSVAATAGGFNTHI